MFTSTATSHGHWGRTEIFKAFFMVVLPDTRQFYLLDSGLSYHRDSFGLRRSILIVVPFVSIFVRLVCVAVLHGNIDLLILINSPSGCLSNGYFGLMSFHSTEVFWRVIYTEWVIFIDSYSIICFCSPFIFCFKCSIATTRTRQNQFVTWLVVARPRRCRKIR